MNLRFESVVQRNWHTIKAGFTRDLFTKLKPFGVGMKVLRFDGCAKGDEVHVEVSVAGLKQAWVSHITQEVLSEREWSFVDEGHKIPWPLKSWRHHHRVVSLDDQSSKIIDDITYDCCYRWMNPLIYPVLWSTFVIRDSRYKKFFKEEI